MKISLQEFDKLLENKGIFLSQLGLRDIALEKSDALAAISLLQKASRAILGGDVYFKRNDKIEITFANWHSDQKPDENHEEFVQRSCVETENYIERFPESDALPLFVLVIERQTTP